MGVVVIGGGGGGGGGQKVTADGKVVNEREEVIAMFSKIEDASAYAAMLDREDARVIPLSPDI